MKSEKIYKEWISSINLAKTRVVRFPSLIFLCGGKTSDDGKKFKSYRDIFYHHIKRTNNLFKEKFILAEYVFDYFNHSAYRDLLSFERDLAELSALTIIFSESPGSIAELGSFAVLETVKDKLLVVMHKDDAHQKSFIWRGPVLHLEERAKENKKPAPIRIYNWEKKLSQEGFLLEQDFSDAEDLAEAIDIILSKFPKTISFKKDQLGHVMLFILDLLKIIQLATIEEIVFILNSTSISYNRRTVEQHLSLLISLKLAEKEQYGNNVYYFSSPHEPWLLLAYDKMSKIRDLDRWKARFTDHYDQFHKQKHRALRSYMKSKKMIGD